MDHIYMSKKSSNTSNTDSKKWSFGRFFRRGKKEIESESSSENGRKAGFSPAQKYPRNIGTSATPNTTSKLKTSASSSSQRNDKLMSGGIDHNVTSPITGNSSTSVASPVGYLHIDNQFFLPVETVSPMGSQESFYKNHCNPSKQSAKSQRLHQSQQYLSHLPQTQQQIMSRSVNFLERRASTSKQRYAQRAAKYLQEIAVGSSSEEEIISLNSSTFTKYRSDESIHSGGQGQNYGQSRKSRAARNKRYYKRLSRDSEVSHGQVPVMITQQTTQKWKTQPGPVSINQAQMASQSAQHPEPQIRPSTDNLPYSQLCNTSTLQHMVPYVQWGQHRQQQPKNLQNSVNVAKRSMSYDSQIHLQNVSGRLQTKPMPPPPPPRDPLRRVNIGGHMRDCSSTDLRPVSYAFDQACVPNITTTGLTGKCVSDDKLWAQKQPQYQSLHSLNVTRYQANQVQHQSRRFISRANRDAQPGKKSLPNGLDFHYVADAIPRSRKPIQTLDQKQSSFTDEVEEPPSSRIFCAAKSGLQTSPTKVIATEFWKRMESSKKNNFTSTSASRGRDLQRSSVVDSSLKPRSISTSHVEKLREVLKPNKSKAPSQQRCGSSHPEKERDEIDGVVCGSLRIKAVNDNSAKFVEIRNKDVPKSQSMPNHYQRRSGEIHIVPNKYEEYVNERREQYHNAPQPPSRTLSGVPHIPQFSFPRKKPANLEEAINELEAIYWSLGLTKPEPERVDTPSEFVKFALGNADEYDDDDSPAGEPDPIRDDVAYRNIKLANLQHKSAGKQPPFGIPVGPIVPASQTDYLHVRTKPISDYFNSDTKVPDIVMDDLAVRSLRKDPVIPNSARYQYLSGNSVKKNRATRTQSANIYALIQRDAAKPSGGNVLSYLELTKNIDRSESLSDLHKNYTTKDIPSTLKLLQNLKEQEREQDRCIKKLQIPFRNPSQGGAICQLPEKLSSSEEKPKPLPRKSLTPEPRKSETHNMEEALNKIAQDAEESSIKLSQEIKELRKEALITNSKPKRFKPYDEKIEMEIEEIEKVSQAAKECGKMILENLSDSKEPVNENGKMSRKLHKDDKLIKAIDKVSEAANKVCEKILKDIVTSEPIVIVQEAIRVKQQTTPTVEINKDLSSSLVIPTLIKNLDPIQSDKIEAIARRCMRQLSDLADNNDYDNLSQPEIIVAITCNLEDKANVVNLNDLSNSNLTETNKTFFTTKPQHIIGDIDQIMKQCEDDVRKQGMAQDGNAVQRKKIAESSATASSFSSSSECLAKSTSLSAGRRFSSSITSFNPYSSSDYLKSPSSDFHAPSTDCIKSCSTTSYDVQSTTSATPNITTTTNSNFSGSPSPPSLNMTPISATTAWTSQRALSSSRSQYNSAEELAKIFGIEENPEAIQNQKLQKHSGNKGTPTSAIDISMPEYELQLTAASPKLSYNANDCCTKTNPNECCLLNLSLYSSLSSTTNTNATSHQHLSSSASSSAGYRAQTTPELDFAKSRNSCEFKLSPNFSRIYASRVYILLDKFHEDEHDRNHIAQSDSINSLEEFYSITYSGNIILADFPLNFHSGNGSFSHHLFVSRIEGRNNFNAEIAINTEKVNNDQDKNNIDRENDGLDDVEEFPPLSTAEELSDSIKESNKYLPENKNRKIASARKDQDMLRERIFLATVEIMTEVKALQASVFQKEQCHQNGNKILVDEMFHLDVTKGFEDILELFEGEISDFFIENDDLQNQVLMRDGNTILHSFSEIHSSLHVTVDENLNNISPINAHRIRSVIFECNSWQ